MRGSVVSLFWGVVFVLVGMQLILASLFRWKWFLSLRKVKLTYDTLGERGATVFYIAVGLTPVVVGILTLTKAMSLD